MSARRVKDHAEKVQYHIKSDEIKTKPKPTEFLRTIQAAIEK